MKHSLPETGEVLLKTEFHAKNHALNPLAVFYVGGEYIQAGLVTGFELDGSGVPTFHLSGSESVVANPSDPKDAGMLLYRAYRRGYAQLPGYAPFPQYPPGPDLSHGVLFTVECTEDLNGRTLDVNLNSNVFGPEQPEYIVDMGDGTEYRSFNGLIGITHVYAASGTYTMKITGDLNIGLWNFAGDEAEGSPIVTVDLSRFLDVVVPESGIIFSADRLRYPDNRIPAAMVARLAGHSFGAPAPNQILWSGDDVIIESVDWSGLPSDLTDIVFNLELSEQPFEVEDLEEILDVMTATTGTAMNVYIGIEDTPGYDEFTTTYETELIDLMNNRNIGIL